MTDVLYVGDRVLQTDEIPTLLKRYELLPKFIEELAIDEAIAGYDCTPEEKQQALLDICQRYQLANLEQQQQWMDDRGLNARDVELIATRPLRIQKYKEDTWGKKVRRHFMERKPGLDTVTYSLIRTQDIGLANELYYRILEGEVSFEECATTQSQGPEARTGGKMGPVPLNRPHPLISKLLSVSQPGQLWPPRTIPNSDWHVIVRLEEFVPAQLDDRMRQALLDDLYNTWLQERVKTLTAQVLSPAQQAESAEKAHAAEGKSRDDDPGEGEGEGETNEIAEGRGEGEADSSTNPSAIADEEIAVADADDTTVAEAENTGDPGSPAGSAPPASGEPDKPTEPTTSASTTNAPTSLVSTSA